MGELDMHRRSAFLPVLERAHHTCAQVFMTCTAQNWPEELGRQARKWNVKAGLVTEG